MLVNIIYQSKMLSSPSRMVQSNTFPAGRILTIPITLSLTWTTCTTWFLFSHRLILGTGLFLSLMSCLLIHIYQIYISQIELFLEKIIWPCTHLFCLVISHQDFLSRSSKLNQINCVANTNQCIITPTNNIPLQGIQNERLYSLLYLNVQE